MSKLGRGLSALIPEKSLEEPDEKKLEDKSAKLLKSGPEEIDIQLIKANPRQPRKVFDEEKIKELAKSIRNNGLLQPLLVVKKGTNYFELIAGERRLRASRLAGLEKVPVIVKEIKNDKERLEIALIENVQREDLNPIEEAEGYKRLKDEFHLTQEEIAERTGKNRSTIANNLRLLGLPDEILDGLRAKKITAGHARALLSIKNEAQLMEEFNKLTVEDRSVREVEENTQKLVDSPRKKMEADPEIKSIKDQIEESLSTKVDLKDRKGSGKITINYYSREELRGILNVIQGT